MSKKLIVSMYYLSRRIVSSRSGSAAPGARHSTSVERVCRSVGESSAWSLRLSFSSKSGRILAITTGKQANPVRKTLAARLGRVGSTD